MSASFSVPSNWYESFFSGPALRFWEAAVPAAATDADAGFVRRHLGCHPPARIMDLPCGAGRHALPLAQAGFEVTGVDLSETWLDRARTQARSRGLAVNFIRANMLDVQVDPVDALICMGNSLGYFEPRLTQQLLSRFASMLRACGRLILDTGICAESLLPFTSRRRYEFSQGAYEQEFHYDTENSVLETRAQLTFEGERHELLYRHFVVTSGELVRWLRAAGFGIVGMFGDAQDRAFEPGSPRLLLVASRDD